jgi:hypothetical protein
MNQIVRIQASYQEEEYFSTLISKKKKRFVLLNKRYEKLNGEINAVQAEYDMRIGTLLRKISILDYEIEKYRAAHKLVRKGLSIEEALSVVDAEIKQKHTKEKEEAWEYFDLGDMENIIPEEAQKLVRKLWKKLAQKYHPDLADDRDDKKRREQLMKLINNAYAKKDLDALKALEEKDLMVETQKGLDVAGLEKVLVDLENAMIRVRNAVEVLKKSQWYSWRKKTSGEKNALFADLESNLMREIIRKEFSLSDLKRGVQ